MNLLVIGVNHKTAPIALREQLAFADEQKKQALQQLTHCSSGAIIVSTCNRTEIYALAADNVQGVESKDELNASIRYIQRWLSTNKGIPLAELEKYLYIYKDSQAINHWIRVASGLDSMILGEPQILGQIKQSVQTAIDFGSVSNQLSWVIDQVFSAAKRVRHETQVGAQAVTLGFATAKLATQIFEDVKNCCLLLVASGAMNRLVAKHIVGLGISHIIICNRSIENAHTLAHELRDINPLCRVDVRSLDELNDALEQADIVCSSSGSMYPLIHVSTMKTLIKKRRYRPMLMVDLAVPRDIEEKVAKLDEVYLYSIDDLQHVIAGNLEQRKQAAVEAEFLISQLVVDVNKNFRVRNVGTDIQAFRQVANEHAEQILNEFLQRLPQRLPQQQYRQQCPYVCTMPSQNQQAYKQKITINSNKSTHKTNSTMNKSDGNNLNDIVDINDARDIKDSNAIEVCNVDDFTSVEELMTELTRRLTQTLTHAPSKLMRKVASEGEDQALETVVSTLIDAYRE